MAHPFAGKASTGQSRAKSLSKGYAVGGAIGKAATANVAKYAGGGKAGAIDLKPTGRASGGRLDKFARGGRAKGKHKGTHINIVNVAPGGKDAGAAPGGPPVPPMMPPIPPKPPGAGIGGPPGLPPGGPPGLPMGGPPGMPPKPPGMMKRGGRIKYARGGFTGGAETGVGRLQKASRAKRKG